MTRWIGLLAAAAVVVAIPAFAYGQPERAPGSIVAVDFSFQNPADGAPLVTINPGETVTFSYPAGSNFHNVRFTKEQPTSCTLTAGGAGPVPPLPAIPSATGWSGTCTFNAEGTYEFVCDAPRRHARRGPGRAGRRDAHADAQHHGDPDPRTPTPTARHPRPRPRRRPPTAAPQSTVAPTPTAPPAAQTSGPAAGRLQLARTQRGQAVKGSLDRRPGRLAPARRRSWSSASASGPRRDPSTRAAPPSRSSSTPARSGRSSAAAASP